MFEFCQVTVVFEFVIDLYELSRICLSLCLWFSRPSRKPPGSDVFLPASLGTLRHVTTFGGQAGINASTLTQEKTGNNERQVSSLKNSQEKSGDNARNVSSGSNSNVGGSKENGRAYRGENG